jgi:hypothetical protein
MSFIDRSVTPHAGSLGDLITIYNVGSTGVRVGFSDKPARTDGPRFSWCPTASVPSDPFSEGITSTASVTF